MSMKMRTKVLAGSFVCSLVALAAVTGAYQGNDIAQGAGCTHPKVNHYEAKDPTSEEEGLSHEYWVCCSCHKKWLDSGYTDEIERESIVLNKKTESSSIDGSDSSRYLINKLNNSSLSNVSEHGLYSNDGKDSFFIKNGSVLDGVTSFVFSDIPSNTHTVSLSYKYYDLNHDLYTNNFHAFATYGGSDCSLALTNDNAWHTLSITIGGASSLSFSINHFQGELFVADIVYESDFSLSSVFSSTSNFDHYFRGTSYTLDTQNKKAVFSNLGTLYLNKTLFDQALSEGYTHMRFTVNSLSSDIVDMHLNGGSYQKLYSGSENTIRIDLTKVAEGDYSNVTLAFRNSSCASAIGDVTLSDLCFYTDDITTSWSKSNNAYACFEGDSLVLDTCYSGNDAYIDTSSDWYAQFVEGGVVNMYVFSEYLKQGSNYRGVLWGKNSQVVDVISLGEWAYTNQAYASKDTFRFCLEKEGVASLQILSSSAYNKIKARERLSKAFSSSTSFSTYFYTGTISDATSFSDTNKSVTYSSRVLCLKQALITDMSLACYTNIAFSYKATPDDGNGDFDHFVYISDGINATDGWKIIYDEFDTPSIPTSLSVDIDLSKAFSYSYSSDNVITIYPRRNGTGDLDSTQTISNLHFYNSADLGKTCNLTFSSSEGSSTSMADLAKAFTLPEGNDSASGVFKGWVSNGITYQAGDVIYPTEDMAFTASYEEDLFSLKSDDYVIVYEANNESASWAANDLKKYINSVLGVSPTVVSDSDYTFSTNAKAISIGNTSALKSINDVVVDGSFVSVDEVKSTLLTRDDSFAIASKKNALYLFGNSNNSLRYASTKFIEDKLGVSFFSSTEESAKEKDDVVIQNGGKAYNPYFNFRTYLTTDAYGSANEEKYSYNSHFYNDSDYSSLSSIHAADNAWITGTFKDAENKDTSIGTAHTTYDANGTGLVKSSTYPLASYPNMWYCAYDSNITDIHYTDGVTSEGKIDRSTSATDTACEAMYDSLKAVLTSYYSSHDHSEKAFLSVGQADTNECCKCDACLASALKYNNSGTMIRFYNAIINELKEDSVLKDCNFQLVMFAYQYNLFSPVIHTMNVTEETSGIINKTTTDKTITGYTYSDSDTTTDATAIPDPDHLYIRVAPLVMDQYLGVEEDADYELQRFNGRIYDENANKWMVNKTTYGDRLGHYKASILFTDWAKVTDNLLSWYYDAAFGYGYATYTGGVSRIERFVDSMKSNSFEGAFIQGNFQDNIYVDTLLNAYVFSKLCWDDNALSAEQLRDQFIDAYFDSASASYVKEYYSLMDGYYSTAFSTSGFGYNYANIANVSVDDLYTAKCKLDKAYKATTDETIKGRIERLQLTPMFMMGKLNSDWRQYFIDVFEKYGGTYVAESTPLANYTW